MLRTSRLISLLFGTRLRRSRDGGMRSKASVYHAVVMIFFEYFAWGLLTVPVINVSLP